MNSSIRIRAAIAVINKNKILLSPHYLEDGKIRWYLPGGGVDVFENLENAAVREFKEETGFKVKIDSLIDISEKIDKTKNWHSITISYQGTIVGGDLTTEEHEIYGSKEPKWFDLESISKIDCYPPSAVKKVFKR